MFIGHFAVGFAAKRISPRTSLGTYFIAVEWMDLLWPVFLLLGIERVRISPGITKMMPLDLEYMPYSHGLVAGVLWALLLAIFHFAVRRKKMDAALVGFCVLSHWILDALVHRPDMPLLFGLENRVGLGLWNYPFYEALLEIALFFLGLTFYIRATNSKNRRGDIGLWILVVLLLAFYSSQFVGVVPSNPTEVAVAGNFVWVLIALGYWVDRNRVAVSTEGYKQPHK